MDIFTHFLSGYLVSYWASLSSTGGFPDHLYLIFGTFMAVVPDIDVFLKPLWGKQPHTGHHGITHMLLFIIIISTTIYIAVAAFLGYADLRFLLLLYLTGSMHILWDFVGTGGVRPFYPLQKKYSKLNLEVGANPLLGAYSLLSLILLLAIYFIPDAQFADFTATSFLVGAGYLLDLGSRAAIKFYYSQREDDRDFAALPTLVPWRWRFAERKEDDNCIEVALKTSRGPRKYIIPRIGFQNEEGASSSDALISTYWLSQVQDRLRIFDYPYYRIDYEGDSKSITWNAAEMGRVMDVIVTCKVDKFNESKFIVSTQFHRSLKNYWDDLSD